MNTPTIEQMLKAGMHFGHRTSKWHPKMKPYIFGVRNGIHIIDLVKSKKMMENSLELMKKFSAEGKTILFVGTKMQAKKHIKAIALETGMPYVCEKWMGGCLTNFNVLKRMTRRYRDLMSDKAMGNLSKYTKKERLDIDKNIHKLDIKVGGVADMNKMPDLMFVWDIKNEATAVIEAKKKNIPVIGICDTNVNPDPINYIIPSNDDATKTIKLILGAVKEAILEGKNQPKKAE